MNKTAKDFTVTELKAMAYDQLAIIENAQQTLRVINQELSSREEKPVENVEETVEAKETPEEK